MRILLIHDECCREALTAPLTMAGLIVLEAQCSDDGLELARHFDNDLIVVDKAVPDALRLLRIVRAAGVRTPILALTEDDAEVRVKCFDRGADDCLTRPFDGAELVARTHAIIRRFRGHGHSTIHSGNLAVDVMGRTATVGQRHLDLTRREFQVLELLSLRKGAIISSDLFLDHIYGGEDEPECNIITQLISRLRRKLGRAIDGADYIETIAGRGYALRDLASEQTGGGLVQRKFNNASCWHRPSLRGAEGRRRRPHDAVNQLQGVSQSAETPV